MRRVIIDGENGALEFIKYQTMQIGFSLLFFFFTFSLYTPLTLF